jgi:hypothetical protein
MKEATMSSDWFVDRFSDTDCMHLHVVPVSNEMRRFVEGEDVQEQLLCLDCLEHVSEAEVRATWQGERTDCSSGGDDDLS